ncbi:DUF2202 domain-containing protein [Flexithrix dorotheae]|uniref:DUF2202 domain-containing protein n=1 Tax=Flexithrix dorotheae TaxID=70993 RepID=UPI000372864A|nr:DUF2202 domain-containing protein [Flexithrix dorotheae]
MKTRKSHLFGIREEISIWPVLLCLLFFLNSSTVPTRDNPLSENEKLGLVLTMEELKLSQDVNEFLRNKWGLDVFVSNQQNAFLDLQKMKRFLKSQGRNNPVEFLPEGKFNLPEHQDIYNTYVVRGKASINGGLYVAILLQEANCLKLLDRVDQTTNPDLLDTYRDLLLSYGNSLRTMHNGMAEMGMIYSPQFLNGQTYETIINKKEFYFENEIM